MSLLVTTSRVFRNSLRHIKRNSWHSLTAVLVMVLTLFVASVLGMALYTSDKILIHLENKLQVTAFFEEAATEEYILQLKEDLELSGQTEEVKYVSRQEALEIFREVSADQPETLEFVTADILPPSLSVSARNLDDLESLAQRLGEDEKVERIYYQEDVTEKFRVWSERIRYVGIILAGYLIAMAILILLIVLSLSIAEFGKEIEIMRLVGASSWYIRWPFILDGIFYGLISAIIASSLVYYLLPYAQDLVNELVTGLNLFPDPLLATAYFLAGSAVLGALLGIIGSSIAIFRHLRV